MGGVVGAEFFLLQSHSVPLLAHHCKYYYVKGAYPRQNLDQIRIFITELRFF